MTERCFAFVEDEPSASVLKRLVEYRNRVSGACIQLHDGFPTIRGGYGNIRKNTVTYAKMARNGLRVIVVVDLDVEDCPPTLIRKWFSMKAGANILLPDSLVFRVAVREIESWIMADRAGLAHFLKIPVGNFPSEPDTLRDPKRELLSIIRRKGRKSWHREMLPQGPTASIGPAYNEKLCDFVTGFWSPEEASQRSPSLRKAMEALTEL